MQKLESNFPEGTYTFTTMSRSIYRITISDSKVVLNRTRDNIRGRELRKDSEDIEVLNDFKIEVGKSAVLTLQPLNPAATFTTRITTPVVKISKEL